MTDKLEQDSDLGDELEMLYKPTSIESGEVIHAFKSDLVALIEQRENLAQKKLLAELKDCGEIHHSVYDYRTEELEEQTHAN